MKCYARHKDGYACTLQIAEHENDEHAFIVRWPDSETVDPEAPVTLTVGTFQGLEPPGTSATWSSPSALASLPPLAPGEERKAADVDWGPLPPKELRRFPDVPDDDPRARVVGPQPEPPPVSARCVMCGCPGPHGSPCEGGSYDPVSGGSLPHDCLTYVPGG